MRIPQIDALRGFALFGIFIVNIFVFHAPYPHYSAFYGTFEGNEKAVVDIMNLLFVGKSMFIYAFLFGYGFWMQYERWGPKPNFRGYWSRRMLWLSVIGVFHVLLLSFGDILLPYALLGLSLPLFARFGNRTLLFCFLFIHLIPVYEFVLRGWLGYQGFFMQPVATLEDYIAINSQGSFIDIFLLRLKDYFSFSNEKLIMYIPKELSLFLLGIIAARSGWATKVRPKPWVAFCVLAIFSAAMMHFFRPQVIALFDYKSSLFQRGLLGLTIHLIEFMHGVLYIIGFFMLWQYTKAPQVLKYLAPAGRMSLTNYIAQSLISVLLFSGLGYYGQWPPMKLAFCATVVYIFQLLLSTWWLQRKQQGPLEYVWRKLAKANR